MTQPAPPSAAEQAAVTKALRDAGFMSSSQLKLIRGRLEAELPSNHGETLMIGNCSIGAFSYFTVENQAINAHIGRYCSIAVRAILNPGNHATNMVSTHPFAYLQECGAFAGRPEFTAITGRSGAPLDSRPNHVTIGSDVWIGAGAIIMGGADIGHGAVVAAGAIVTKPVEPYAIVGGVPARHIRYRFEDAGLRQRLLDLAWWEWDLSMLGPERDYSDPALFAARLGKAIEAGTVVKYAPPKILIENQQLVSVMPQGRP